MASIRVRECERLVLCFMTELRKRMGGGHRITHSEENWRMGELEEWWRENEIDLQGYAVSFLLLFDPRENFIYNLPVGLLKMIRLDMRRLRVSSSRKKKRIIIAIIHVSSKAGIKCLMPTWEVGSRKSRETVFSCCSGASHEIVLQNSHQNVNFKVCTLL